MKKENKKQPKYDKLTPKYDLTSETTKINDIILHRIRALRDISKQGVKKGDLGGWIENVTNLNQYDNSWIGGNAKVFGNAKVYGNAEIWDNAIAHNNVEIYDNASVFGKAVIHANAKVYGNSSVYGDAILNDDAEVYGNSRVYNNAEIRGNAKVYGNARICDYGYVYGNARIHGNVVICGNAVAREHVNVCGNVSVESYAEICGNAVIQRDGDYMIFKNCWSSSRWFTYTKSNKMWKVGCFYGTGDELIKKAYKKSKLVGKCYELAVKYAQDIEKIISKSKKHKVKNEQKI